MGYREALEAAGHVIVDFGMFGSYTGNWAAITDKGQLIAGYYGSCSVCDAYQAAYSNNDYEELTLDQLAVFGTNYEPVADINEWLANEKWDSSDSERAEWVRQRLEVKP